MRQFLTLVVLAVFAVAPALAWEHWGGDRAGMRYSPLARITPANVGHLVRPWEFSTGDIERRAKFQATPLLVEDSLIFCSPFNEVIALDPGSGAASPSGPTTGLRLTRPAACRYSWAPTMPP